MLSADYRQLTERGTLTPARFAVLSTAPDSHRPLQSHLCECSSVRRLAPIELLRDAQFSVRALAARFCASFLSSSSQIQLFVSDSERAAGRCWKSVKFQSENRTDSHLFQRFPNSCYLGHYLLEEPTWSSRNGSPLGNSAPGKRFRTFLRSRPDRLMATTWWRRQPLHWSAEYVVT